MNLSRLAAISLISMLGTVAIGMGIGSNNWKLGGFGGLLTSFALVAGVVAGRKEGRRQRDMIASAGTQRFHCSVHQLEVLCPMCIAVASQVKGTQ